MATVARSKPSRKVEPAEVEPYRFTAAQFDKMVGAGVFGEADRVELLGGVLVDKMVKNPPHNIASGQCHELLLRVAPAGWFADQEKPVAIGRIDRPEPDIFIARGRRQDYPRQPPGPKHLALVVEVADTTYAKDRGVKWHLYAAARIPAYWIVNLNERRVEVYTQPAGRGKAARYDRCEIYGPDATVPVVIDGAEVGRVAVADLLP